ncbi:MAG TPA: nucleoside deaminase [Polyangiaceae bacterium]|nr:nucleoside deaminase [Polyangiaceae bacterium]
MDEKRRRNLAGLAAFSDYAPSSLSAEDLSWMDVALDEARLALGHGDVPVGAVVVGPDGKELARAHNLRERDADPTSHAELVAVRAAARERGHWRLDGCTLFVTLEPCAMCAGALVNARVSRLVFGAHDPKAGAVVSLFELGRDPRLNHRFLVEGGVRAEEAVALLRAFFGELRARGEK